MLVVGATATSLAQRPVQSAQQILEQLERDWIEALQTNNVAFIDSVLAPEFVATYGDGTRGDKSKELSLALDTSQQVDSSRLDEFIIKIFGNTAVVWFTQHLVGPVKGKPTEVTYRYVDVWVNRSGRWLAVASQSTRVNLKE